MPQALGTQPPHVSFRTAWSTIDQMDDPSYFVRYMEHLAGPNADDPALYHALLTRLQAGDGHHMLDVGCGLGALTRVLAGIVGTSGRSVGVDNSATMVAEARSRAAAAGLTVEYRTADAQQLPFENDSFDGCCSLGMLEIVNDPPRALAEMVRVAKPGAAIVTSGIDAGTIAIDATDRTLTRRLIEYYCDHDVNGWIGRQLPGYYAELGLVDVVVEPSTWLITDFALWHGLNMSTGMMDRAQAAGVVSGSELTRWWAEQEQRAATGRFLVAQTVFTVTGRKRADGDNPTKAA